VSRSAEGIYVIYEATGRNASAHPSRLFSATVHLPSIRRAVDCWHRRRQAPNFSDSLENRIKSLYERCMSNRTETERGRFGNFRHTIIMRRSCRKRSSHNVSHSQRSSIYGIRPSQSIRFVRRDCVTSSRCLQQTTDWSTAVSTKTTSGAWLVDADVSYCRCCHPATSSTSAAAAAAAAAATASIGWSPADWRGLIDDAMHLDCTSTREWF